MLDESIENEPNNEDCRILRAGVGTMWAWNARSAALAFLVGERQAQLFHTRLMDASTEIERPKILSPSDSLVYPNAITIKMGLGVRNHIIMSVDTCLYALDNIANKPVSLELGVRKLLHPIFIGN